MTFEDVWTKSALIQKRLVESPLFIGAKRLALYSSCQNEVLTDEVFKKAKKEKKAVCYPRVMKGTSAMLFIEVRSLDELTPGAFDIREPGEAGERAVDPASLDLIVLPGVAFDRRGARLGFGMGFYDRVLTGLSCPLVALAYEFQVTDTVPTESFDVRVNAVITEKSEIHMAA